MRKLFQFTLLLSFFLASNAAYSQINWQWDDHGVGFSAPENLRVVTNNADEFTALGRDLQVTIRPLDNGSITEEHLAEVLITAAQDMQYDEISDIDVLEVDDFTGYYVEGVKYGEGALIITLLDKNSSTNLVVVVVYGTDEARDQAIEIVGSFYAFD